MFDRFVTLSESVTLGDATVVLLRPRNADDLIREEDFVRDERLPYWADLWPASRALAEAIPKPPRADARLLELGCGLGLATIAAMRAGWRVTASDYYEDALLFTSHNAFTATGRRPDVRLVDWRALPADIGDGGGYDLIVGADVLYEPDYPGLIAGAIARTIAPGGRALIADPHRVHAPRFPDECATVGLAAHVESGDRMLFYHVVTAR